MNSAMPRRIVSMKSRANGDSDIPWQTSCHKRNSTALFGVRHDSIGGPEDIGEPKFLQYIHRFCTKDLESVTLADLYQRIEENYDNVYAEATAKINRTLFSR